MDQARSVINSHIPATQWAMDYLNKSLVQPLKKDSGDFVKGYMGKPGEGVTSGNSAQSLGDSVANAIPGESAVVGLLGKLGRLAQDAHTLPLALGIVSNSAGKFGSALRNANKGFNIPIHPDDINEVSPAIERLLTNGDNAHYYINQLPQDHAAIAPIAEHYMPGVTKTLKNDPTEMARALLQRIILDRKEISN